MARSTIPNIQYAWLGCGFTIAPDRAQLHLVLCKWRSTAVSCFPWSPHTLQICDNRRALTWKLTQACTTAAHTKTHPDRIRRHNAMHARMSDEKYIGRYFDDLLVYAIMNGAVSWWICSATMASSAFLGALRNIEWIRWMQCDMFDNTKHLSQHFVFLMDFVPPSPAKHIN